MAKPGQITSDFQKLSSPQSKNISLHISVNQNYNLRHPGPHEGRFAIVTKRRAGDVMDALASGVRLSARTKTPRRTAKSCGPDTRCWCQACERFLAGDGDKTNSLHRGEHEVRRKAIAQGMSECFRCPVCSCAPKCTLLAHETAGAARTRHSLRPLFEEGQRDAKLGRKLRREDAKACPLSRACDAGVFGIARFFAGQMIGLTAAPRRKS